jgi:hypothetical protein
MQHVYIHICAHTHTHATNMQTHTHTHTHTHHTQTHAHTNTRTHMQQTHTRTHAHTHARTHTYKQTHAHTNTSTHTHDVLGPVRVLKLGKEPDHASLNLGSSSPSAPRSKTCCLLYPVQGLGFMDLRSSGLRVRGWWFRAWGLVCAHDSILTVNQAGPRLRV